jgi:hypothetical protein
MHSMLKKLSSLTAAALLAAACGSSTAPEQLQASVPDYAGLSLEATGAASEAASLESGAPSAALTADTSSPALTASGLEFLPAIRTAIHDLNQGVQQFFAPIGQLITTQGQDIVVGQSKSFGPMDQGGVTYLLTVKRLGANRFAWKLEGKPTGAAADVALTGLAAGTVFHAAADQIHRGRGQIGIDLDAFKTVKPDFAGQGKLYGAYSHFDVSAAASNGGAVAGDSKTLVYVLKDFTLDASAHPPVSAAFVGHKTLAGVRAVRVLYYGDLPQFVGNPDHAELLLGRARYNPGVGGRADALVTGGDVPNGELIFGAECWDKSENLTWQKVWACTAPGSCTVQSEVGNVSACDVDLRNDAPEAPTDGTSSVLEPGAPDPSVLAPLGMPSFDAP